VLLFRAIYTNNNLENIMHKKLAIFIVTIFTMLTAPATIATAGAGDAIVGGVVGGIVGGVIVNEVYKNKQNRATVTHTSTYNTAQRQENRDVQTALNYYSFPAGGADGVFGRRTRNAISSYQIFLDYPATGYLTEFQKVVLINSYHRSIAGGVTASQVVSTSPYGARGMLKHVHQGMAGVPNELPQQASGQTASTSQNSAAFQLPSFGDAPDTNSIANHCNKISLITNTNGGYTNVSTMQDPVFTLNEQFCLARIYAISTSEDMINLVQGSSAGQIQTQCETLGPAFRTQVSALSLGTRDQVIAKTSEMILSAGMSPAQLTHTAKICLGIGYRTDNAEVALASTLILVALGEPVYGELLGHHLLNGFGTTQRNDLALQWYTSSTDAIAKGQPAVFVPGQSDRPTLIRAAAEQLNSSAAALGQSQTTGFVVPAFGAEATTTTND
jgi:peptidoglycan hydrolase-like protein with peptidoglycan-binding domain